MQKATNVQNWIGCENCFCILPYEPTDIKNYFLGAPFVCEECGHKQNLFSTVRKNIEKNFMLNSAFGFIGAKTVIFNLSLLNGKRTTYKRSDYGIPIGSKILYVNYTPGGWLFPTEQHGNIIFDSKKFDEITVYPVPFGDGEIKEPVEVNVMTTWIEKNSDIDSTNCIIDAFIAYADEDYCSMIIPANSAVEYALTRFLTKFIGMYCSKKRTDDFLSSVATYSSQLNVLLPLVCCLKGITPLDNSLRGSLNRLRDLRNQVAHTGHLGREVTKKDAATLLTASLFAYKYILLVEELTSNMT